MISLDNTPVLKENNTYEFSFTGLSTDTKPVTKYDHKKIANGSTFFEMDNQNVVFYDAESGAWLED